MAGSCWHCGAATTSGARFCAACGAVLQSAPTATAVTADREPRSLDRQVLRVALLVVLFFVVEVVTAEVIAAVAGEHPVGIAASYLIAGAVTFYAWRSSRR